MTKISKLVKMNESITIHRYDNGWMVEITGLDKDGNWATTKTICLTEEELITLIKEYNAAELDK